MICAMVADETEASRDDLLAPSQRASARPQLRIFARDHDSRIRFITDGLPVAIGRHAETAFFDSDDEAVEVAAACAAYLARTPGAAADPEGWHKLPRGARLATFLPNLLRVARSRAWSASDPDPPPLAYDPLGPALETPETPPPVPNDVGRPWPRERDALLAYMMGQGKTAKIIAADPRIKSTPLAVYKRASRLGLSFAEAPLGQINFRLPQSYLTVIDRAAAAAGQTRNAFMRGWMMKATSDPDRYNLVMVST